MNKEEIYFNGKAIHVEESNFVNMKQAKKAINDYRSSINLGIYNFRQWVNNNYVKNMLYCIDKEMFEDSFRSKGYDKSELYCNPVVFINMVLSSCPDYDIVKDDWFREYLSNKYCFDCHVYDKAHELAIGSIWRYTSKNARFIEEIRIMDKIMEGSEFPDAVYSLFIDMLDTFYYNWEICLKLSRKIIEKQW